MSRVMIVRGNEWRGFDLLSDGVVDQHFRARSREDRLIQVLKRNPGRFGLGVDEDTAAIIRGSNIEVCGTSDVMICLPMTVAHPAKVSLLRAGQRADLDEFRREARIRAERE